MRMTHHRHPGHCGHLAPLAAQQRAPQNDSIRQDDLRADLFFLAGDSLRGRLTDTEENRAAADFIRSRFERMGLKRAAPNGSYFQTYNLMTATLGDGDERPRDAPATRAARRLRAGQEFYPHRFSASGDARGAGRVRRLRHQRAAARLRRLHRRRCRGKIVLVLDHEPGERDPNSPFDGVVTSEPSTGVAQGAGGAGARRGRRAVRHRRAQSSRRRRTSRPTARNYWPEKPPRILSYTLAAWADRIRIPVAQISPALAASLVRRQRQDARGPGQVGRNRARLTPMALAGAARDRAHRRRSPHRPRPQRRRAARRAAIRG